MFWNNVKSLLKTAGITQKALGIAIGGNERTIEQWINRNSIPDAETALRIARKLNTTVEFLITGKEPEVKDRSTEVIAAIEKTLEQFK